MNFSKTSENKEIRVSFDYSESCKNVYKHFSVSINGNRSNIKGLQKFLKNEYPSILTENTYYWHSDSSASGRRRNEKRRNEMVRNYFLSEGFSEE